MTLPISIRQAQTAARWLRDNFEAELITAAPTAPITPQLLCAIACQESAYVWLDWIDRFTPAEVVAHCVLDASGDAPGPPRTAFPKNTAAFRAAYDDVFTDMLIGEANTARALRGMGPKTWVYKGYGVFQYDLQFVKTDRAFFEQRLWRDFGECARRCVRELTAAYAGHHDLREAVRAYNGSGAAAEQYAYNVMEYLPVCEVLFPEPMAIEAPFDRFVIEPSAEPPSFGDQDFAILSGDPSTGLRPPETE